MYQPERSSPLRHNVLKRNCFQKISNSNFLREWANLSPKQHGKHKTNNRKNRTDETSRYLPRTYKSKVLKAKTNYKKLQYGPYPDPLHRSQVGREGKSRDRVTDVRPTFHYPDSGLTNQTLERRSHSRHETKTLRTL